MHAKCAITFYRYRERSLLHDRVGGLALYNAQRAVERGFHGRLAAAAQRVLGTAGGVRLAYYIIMVVKGHALGHSGVICYIRFTSGTKLSP